MIERYSYYDFQIKPHDNNTWVYEIHTDGCPPYWNGIVDSDEWFETEQEARFAAIGHITKLENYDPEPDYDAKPPFSIDWEERRKLGE